MRSSPILRDKLAGLCVHGVSGDYRDTLRKLPVHAAMSPCFANLLRALCETCAEREIFAGLSDLRAEDRLVLANFLAERQAFVRGVGSNCNGSQLFGSR